MEINPKSENYITLIVEQFGADKPEWLKSMLVQLAKYIKDEAWSDVISKTNEVNVQLKYWPPELVWETNLIPYEKSMLYIRNIVTNFPNKWIPTRSIDSDHFREVFDILEENKFGPLRLDADRNNEFFMIEKAEHCDGCKKRLPLTWSLMNKKWLCKDCKICIKK